jgi:L-iditol 2-dehydrogenase
MRSAQLVEVGRIEVADVERPAPGGGELLVQVKSVGICGSDLHYFLAGGLGSFKETLPKSMGHEPAGVVVEADGSRRFRPGDRVAVEPARPCLRCRYCLRGQHNLCVNNTFLGSGAAPGAMSDYLAVSEHQLEPLTEQLSFDEGALMEPLGVGCHAVSLAGLPPAAAVAIFGVGPVGLCIMEMARRAGAATVFAVDPLAHRREYALAHGADAALAESDEAPRLIREQTGGFGVDAAFDAAGTQASVDHCHQAAAAGGTVVLVGIPGADHLRYNPHTARIKELRIVNVRRSNGTLSRSREVVGPAKLREMVTHRFPLERAQGAFELAANYRDGVIKAMVTVDS